MSRKDQPTFYPGPSPKAKRALDVDRLEQKVNAVTQGTTTGATNLQYGTVTSYNSATRTGMVTVDGTSMAFTNASGISLLSTDIIVVGDVEGYAQKVGLGLLTRASDTDTIIYENPYIQPPFPIDGDAQPTPMVGVIRKDTTITGGVAQSIFYTADNALGFTNPILVSTWYDGTPSSATILGVIIYDTVTGLVTTVPMPSSIPTSGSDIGGIVALGDYLYIQYGQNNSGSPYNFTWRWHSGTGVWERADSWSGWPASTTADSVWMAGLSNGRLWFLRKNPIAGSVYPYTIYSVNAAGAVTAGYTGSTINTNQSSMLTRAGNGYLYAMTPASPGALPGLWVAPLNSDGSVGTVNALTRSAVPIAISSGDIAHVSWCRMFVNTSGELLMLTYSGTPASIGFAKIAPNGSATYFNNLSSYTIYYANSITEVNGVVVIGGAFFNHDLDPTDSSSRLTAITFLVDPPYTTAVRSWPESLEVVTGAQARCAVAYKDSGSVIAMRTATSTSVTIGHAGDIAVWEAISIAP